MPGITASRGPGLTIGALSRHAGVNIETIRFYERAGVLPKPPRSAGGHRVYNEDQLKRLSFVRRSRELGFSLDEVRGLLRLVDGGHYTCAEVKVITLDHLDDIRRKIADLRRLERILSEVAGKCRGENVPECPVIDALFSPVPSTSAAVIRARRASGGRRGHPEARSR
jgi:MerR family mercuric resistance operon transcriptional regulator